VLLAIDTSTRNIGIAIYDGVQVLCETTWNSHNFHTVELAPAVDDTLQRARVQMQDLKLVAIATGPGSFTGLRIGMALAKGIALARHIPLIGIPTLDIVAEALPVSPGFTLAAILQAGRGRLAVGWYTPTDGSWQHKPPIQVLEVAQLSQLIHEPTIICGELTEVQQRTLARKYRNVILASPAHSVRRPSFLAELAWKRWLAGESDDPATIAPTYLHIGGTIPA
jgi:tRNA threonylcarbamoyladenosine biosynthesis protein TsaB